MSFAHVPRRNSPRSHPPAHFSQTYRDALLVFLTLRLCLPHRAPPAQQALLHHSPSAASTKEHQMGWHCLVSWPNGCLFKHRSCLHCCGSLHVKHSPLKPYANPIKVSAVQRGEAITIKSQVCLLSSRKENLIEQLKAKSDSVQHHVEDRRFSCSRACGGQEEINGRAGESNCALSGGL